MRSLHVRILLTCFGTLLVSLLAFVAISLTVGQTRAQKGFGDLFRLQLTHALSVHGTEGPAGLARFLRNLDTDFESLHYVVDAGGRDLVTGEVRPELVVPTRPTSATLRNAQRVLRHLVSSEGLASIASDDGRYRLFVIARPWSSIPEQAPYYVALLVIVSVLYSLIAVRMASSLRAITAAADRLGHGDWDARVKDAERSDELGTLARTFNSMAERLSTARVSERRLLQDVSHELRSPLARLAFAAELARTAPDRNGAIDRIQKQVTFLTQLVSSLLQVTRAEGDPSTHRSEDIALDVVLDEVVATCGLEADERQCQLRVQGRSSHLVIGDKRLITRAIDNVVRNAVHYSPAGATVDIDLRDADEAVVVEVRDYGEGVPESMLTAIFDPFFRVDDSRQQSTGGVGLGLAIVRRIVELHNGSVQAVRMQPGLKIVLTLPSTTSHAVAHTAPRSAA